MSAGITGVGEAAVSSAAQGMGWMGWRQGQAAMLSVNRLMMIWGAERVGILKS